MWLYPQYQILDLTKTERMKAENRYWLGITPSTCLYCAGELEAVPFDALTTNVRTCPYCGWWVVSCLAYYEDSEMSYRRDFWRYAGVLRRLEPDDISEPMNEVKQYLTANYDIRFVIEPTKFESIVASVFKDFGYRVRLTGSSGDDGIDIVVLEDQQCREVGVQVKRFRGKIEAAQIREFAGALLLRGMTKGIYVTTSSFTKGARKTSRRFRLRGLGITLVDCDRFYKRLRMRRQDGYSSGNAPFREILDFIDKHHEPPPEHRIHGEWEVPFDF